MKLIMGLLIGNFNNGLVYTALGHLQPAILFTCQLLYMYLYISINCRNEKAGNPFETSEKK